MRKSVSVAFFSLVSHPAHAWARRCMGSSELGAVQQLLRAGAVRRRWTRWWMWPSARRPYLVQQAALPEGEELEALNTKLELIGESAEAYLFFTDCDGKVVLASRPGRCWPADVPEAQ
ncbi:MAG: hypothetical protein ACLVJH_10690 [Faecalibacterium prausnitzii]